MIYQLLQAQEDLLARLRPLVADTAGALRRWDWGRPETLPLLQAAAALDLLEGLGTTHRKPAFGLDATQVDGRRVEVREEVVAATPFCALRRFAKPGRAPGPRVLVVAPLSGHFATRLRDTLDALLPDHDVHVTDWTDGRDLRLSAGAFGLDEMVAHLLRFLEVMGPGAHLVAVSQPAVAALAATALLAEDASPVRPRSLTLLGGPIDTRIRPTPEEALAALLPLSWFEQHTVAVLPPRFVGAGRRVHPGAQQYLGSMLAELPGQWAAQLGQLRALVSGDTAAAAAHRAKHDELRAVMDVPAELYLDTIERVFTRHELARGTMAWRGRPVRPAAIYDTALRVIAGEESCPPGQGSAALGLCTGLPAALKHHHLQPGGAHDTLFEGAAWRAEILPLVRGVIAG